MKKIGIVDVGGGYRGVYAAGVLDYCMDYAIHFDVGVGVSAGSANIISYAANQPRRNRKFYMEYGLRKEYAGVQNFIFKKSFIDLNYVYGTLSNSDGENPLDFQAAGKSSIEFVAVATNAQTGKAKYFSMEDMAQDDYSVLKASCAIPYICHPYAVGADLYYDGALSDTVPIEKAFQMGCDKVVLLLTLPEDTVRSPEQDQRLAKKIQRKYPLAAERLRHRAEQYNQGIAKAKEYAAQGKLLIIAPDDTCGVHTLCRDAVAMKMLYQKGYQDGTKISTFLST